MGYGSRLWDPNVYVAFWAPNQGTPPPRLAMLRLAAAELRRLPGLDLETGLLQGPNYNILVPCSSYIQLSQGLQIAQSR